MIMVRPVCHSDTDVTTYDIVLRVWYFSYRDVRLFV
jgi:hypothetical protein